MCNTSIQYGVLVCVSIHVRQRPVAYQEVRCFREKRYFPHFHQKNDIALQKHHITQVVLRKNNFAKTYLPPPDYQLVAVSACSEPIV